MLASDLERTVTTVTTVTPPPQVLSPDLERMARSFGEMLGFEVTPGDGAILWLAGAVRVWRRLDNQARYSIYLLYSLYLIIVDLLTLLGQRSGDAGRGRRVQCCAPFKPPCWPGGIERGRPPSGSPTLSSPPCSAATSGDDPGYAGGCGPRTA